MILKPYQLVILAIGAFTVIVGANVFGQWRSNEAFREQWKSVNPIELAKFRKVMVAQENLMPVPTEDDSEPVEEE